MTEVDSDSELEKLRDEIVAANPSEDRIDLLIQLAFESSCQFFNRVLEDNNKEGRTTLACGIDGEGLHVVSVPQTRAEAEGDPNEKSNLH